MSDHSRIEELRRRVQRDPASIAFAQLAEEHRRAGQLQEAIDAARAGLVQHPAYLSARVTLGRALLELGQLDEAAAEFEYVVQAAPDNLTAVRQLAEIHQRRRVQAHETRSRMPEVGPPTTPSRAGDAYPAASSAAEATNATHVSPAKQEASAAKQDVRTPTPETSSKPQIDPTPEASPAPRFIVELTSQTAHVAASVTQAPVPPPSPAPATAASPASVTPNAPQPAAPAPLDPVIAELEAWLAVLRDERTARAGHR